MLDLIPNAIPIEQALEVRQALLQADYDLIQQTRHNFYARSFADQQPNIPSLDEVYTSQFYRSNYLESHPLILGTYQQWIKPLVESRSHKKISGHDLRCYKMLPGCHFRIHKDDYQADVGFIWYLNQDWKWDWGGLLLTIGNDNQPRVTIPAFNQLAIMDHQESQIPHCVTQIADYSLEPRLMIVGFLTVA